MRPVSEAWRRRAGLIGREAAVVVFFLGLAILATRPLITDLTGHTIAGGDNSIFIWSLNWTSGHLLRPAELFHGNIFFPKPYGLLYTNPCLGASVLVLPARLVVDDPVLLFNVGMLLTLTFSGWSFHLLSRYLTGDIWAGLLTGVLATFGSGQMAHLYHFDLLCTGWIPLFLLGMHRLVQRPSWSAAALTGVSFSLSAQSDGYYAVAVAALAVVFGLVHIRALLVPATLMRALAAGLLGAGLTLPYLLCYLDLGEMTTLSRAIGESRVMAFQPLRDLGSPAYLYRGLFGPNDGARLFPGFIAVLLSVVAAVRRPRHLGFYLASIGAFLVLSLGPSLEFGGGKLPLPYGALWSVPPFDSMRHPLTFAAVANFLLAVSAGLGWASLPLARWRWKGPLIVALAVGETLSPGPRVAEIPEGVPEAYEFLEHQPPGAIFEVNVFSPEAVIWAARHGRPVVNGRGAFWPPHHGLLNLAVQNHWLRRTPEDVDRSKPTRVILAHLPGVRYLILPGGRRPELERLAGTFERSKIYALLAELADGSRVYEIRRPSEP
jgi:hypothetical protein